MQFDTTSLSTNVLWGWKTSKALFGPWTRWSFTSDVLKGAPQGMSKHQNHAPLVWWLMHTFVLVYKTQQTFDKLESSVAPPLAPFYIHKYKKGQTWFWIWSLPFSNFISFYTSLVGIYILSSLHISWHLYLFLNTSLCVPVLWELYFYDLLTLFDFHFTHYIHFWLLCVCIYTFYTFT
jgi:hypothetical protein